MKMLKEVKETHRKRGFKYKTAELMLMTYGKSHDAFFTFAICHYNK